MTIVAEIDDIIKDNGSDALHPDLNPTEFCGDIKNRVAQECMSMNFKELQMICKKVFAEYSKEKWQNCCSHMKKT
jgi:hypothetical protein